MSKKAAGAAALACGNAACGKALAPPLLQCSKCKGEAYCCKACQVGDPGAPAAHSAPYASARSPAPAPFPPACTPPPPDCRVEGRAQAQVRCARADSVADSVLCPLALSLTGRAHTPFSSTHSLQTMVRAEDDLKFT